MSKVYVDILIVVNIFIDFFLLLCTKKIIGTYTKYQKLILGSIIGGISSLVAILPVLSNSINFLLDLLFAIIIIFITFGKCNIKVFIKRVIIFYMLSFCFCGIMTITFLTLKPKGMQIFNNKIYFDISPVLLIFLTLLCYYILNITKRLTNNVHKTEICNTEIFVGENHFCFCAKYDTGCNVKEPFSGKSVIIAEKSLFEGFSPDLQKTRVIPFTSLGGDGILKGFPADKIIINGKVVNDTIYIGICENVLLGDFKALIPNDLLH